MHTDAGVVGELLGVGSRNSGLFWSGIDCDFGGKKTGMGEKWRFWGENEVLAGFLGDFG